MVEKTLKQIRFARGECFCFVFFAATRFRVASSFFSFFFFAFARPPGGGGGLQPDCDEAPTARITTNRMK